jgi:predicted nucleic acid-binding protein
MILVDSDVMIDILRQYKPALDWLKMLNNEEIGIPGLVAMELIQGCRNSVELQKVEKRLRSYRLYWSEKTDCERALNDYATYHLSNNLGMIDALIAELAVGLNVQLATFNTKHYCVIKSLQIIQPYQRIE